MGWEDEKGDVSERMLTVYKTPSQGCATTLWAATSMRLAGHGGLYCEDCDVAELAGEKTSALRYVARHAVNSSDADKLWQVTEDMLSNAA